MAHLVTGQRTSGRLASRKPQELTENQCKDPIPIYCTEDQFRSQVIISRNPQYVCSQFPQAYNSFHADMQKLMDETNNPAAGPTRTRDPPNLADIPPPQPKLKYTPSEAVISGQTYLKYIPRVYPKELIFDWYEIDYQITANSRKFYRKYFPKQEDGSVSAVLTEMQFVKVIDIFEKLAYVGKPHTIQAMQEGFYHYMAGHPLCPEHSSIPVSVLENIFINFWYDAHGANKAQTLIRKFQDNQEQNESFQNNLKERQGNQKARNMNMRNNAARLKPLQEKMEKCRNIQSNTIDFGIYNLLPMTWDRESHKQVKDRLESTIFDKQYDELCKANGVKGSELAQKEKAHTISLGFKTRPSHQNLRVVIPLPRTKTERDILKSISQKNDKAEREARGGHIGYNQPVGPMPGPSPTPQRIGNKKQPGRKPNHNNIAAQVPNPEIQPVELRPNNRHLVVPEVLEDPHVDSVLSSHHNTVHTDPVVAPPMKDHAVCDLSMIEKISKLMAYGASERNFSFKPNALENYITWPDHASSDVYLRSQNFLEPGPGYVQQVDEPILLPEARSESEDLEKEFLKEILDSESETESTNEDVVDPKINYLHDQLAKRDYVIRRGRNNRIMCRSINQMVFNDDLFWAHENDVFFPEKSTKDTFNLLDQFKMNKGTGQIQSIARGENLYKQKYDDIWHSQELTDRRRDVKSERKFNSKRISNFELALADYPGLKAYEQQRNLQTNCQRTRYTRSIQKVGECNLNTSIKAIANSALGAANKRIKVDTKVHSSTMPESGSPTKERRIAASAVSQDQSESVSVEQDSNLIFDEELQHGDPLPILNVGATMNGIGASVPQPLATHDFISRKNQGQREFLVNFMRNGGEFQSTVADNVANYQNVYRLQERIPLSNDTAWCSGYSEGLPQLPVQRSSYVQKPQQADSQMIQKYLSGKSLTEAKKVDAFSQVESFKHQSKSLGSQFAQFKQAGIHRGARYGGRQQPAKSQGGQAPHGVQRGSHQGYSTLENSFGDQSSTT